MTETEGKLPEWAMEMAKAIADIWQHPAHHDYQIFMEDIARALVAAERRGLERGAMDTDRLDFLDSLNERLNARYGTNYRWEMIINHNINRLMFNFPRGVDLNDAKAHGFPSCRQAIDQHMSRITATRAAIRNLAQEGEKE